MPVLSVWGDNLPPDWVAGRDLFRAMKETHPNVESMYLPDHGITGSGHFMMDEFVNDVIAEKMINWLEEKF